MAGEYDLLLRDAWPGDSEMVKELRAVVVACILEQFGELPPIEILVGLSAQDRAAIVTAGAKVTPVGYAETTITLRHTSLFTRAMKLADEWAAKKAEPRAVTPTSRRRATNAAPVQIVAGKEAFDNPDGFAELVGKIDDRRAEAKGTTLKRGTVSERLGEIGLEGLKDVSKPPVEYIKELQRKADGGRDQGNAFFPGEKFPKSLYPYQDSEKNFEAGKFGSFAAFLQVPMKWGLAGCLTEPVENEPIF